MRKFCLILALVLLPFAVMVSAQDAEGWTCPEGFEGQTLSVYNWSTYIADDTIPNFEAACGVTVVYDVYESNEAMLARLSQGNPGFDIVVPTDYAISILIAEGLLEPIDVANIPNFANVSETLANPAYDAENQYTVPYLWGTVGVGYNVEAVGGEITSWEQVWNHDGPVAWLEDARGMMGIALSILGYDPNTTDEAQIAEARDFLIERGGNVVTIAADDGQTLLAEGNVDITVEYSGDIFQVIAECECDDYAFALPEPASYIWVDNLAIPAGAPNAALAQVFMDYILDPQVGAAIANETGYATANQLAIDEGLVDAEYLENPIVYPTDEVRERLFLINANPEGELALLTAWEDVRIALGQ